LTSALVGRRSQFHSPAALPPLDRRLDGAQKRSGRLVVVVVVVVVIIIIRPVLIYKYKKLETRKRNEEEREGKEHRFSEQSKI
jgi:NhaP-type Na+/H+ or K+/H+ antiporter